MRWVTRGLRNGIVTTRYPARADNYGPGYRGAVAVTDAAAASEEEAEALCRACPSGAIRRRGARILLDQGACVLCGRCVELAPTRVGFAPSVEVACTSRRTLVVPSSPHPVAGASQSPIRRPGRRRWPFRRSVHVRHVDAGSDGLEEEEILALTNPVYDVQRLGIFFTASPRHADLLLVTGSGVPGMVDALWETYEAMPQPRLVVAVGTDAVSGGFLGAGGVDRFVPVDVYVPGSPPSPFSILHGILLAIGQLQEGDGG